jgi:hypothetical protein
LHLELPMTSWIFAEFTSVISAYVLSLIFQSLTKSSPLIPFKHFFWRDSLIGVMSLVPHFLRTFVTSTFIWKCMSQLPQFICTLPLLHTFYFFTQIPLNSQQILLWNAVCTTFVSRWTCFFFNRIYQLVNKVNRCFI